MSGQINPPQPQRPLWYWQELAEAVGAATNSPETKDSNRVSGLGISGVSIDTRSLQQGDLFIALAGDPGERFYTSSPGTRDGHEFLSVAAEKGASGALVSTTAPLGLPQLRVGDTLDGLWALGRAAVNRHRGTRIAVTGSSGKTTAKAFLGAALAATTEAGSLNNFWGVPLCLARTPLDAAFGVYEIGTNRAGEIAPLATLVRPHAAIVLNVHPAHIGNFASIEELRKEKLSISSGLDSISNLICEYSVAQVAGLSRRTLTFGDQPSADVRLTEIRGDRAVIETPRGLLDVRVPGGGRHRALTLAAVIATLISLDEDPARAADLPASLVPEGRGNEHLVSCSNGGEWVLIDDSYNANPVSMAAALVGLTEGVFGDTDSAARYAIIGEMLELGEQAESYHLGLLEPCKKLAGVFCVGKGMRSLYDALPSDKRLGYADSVKEINTAELLERLPHSGKLLVKGSNRVFWSNRFCSALATALRASQRAK